MRYLRHLALGLSLMTVISAAALAADAASYTTTVQLNNGKHVKCAVNEPVSGPADGAQPQTLSRSEINEAELKAIVFHCARCP
jgi:hypothetical protein